MRLLKIVSKLVNLLRSRSKTANFVRLFIILPIGLFLVAFLAIKLFTGNKAVAVQWSKVHGDYSQRKQLTLVNNSGQAFEAGTTYQVSIDTKSLYNKGQLKGNCDDLRVVYQPSETVATELKRAVSPSDGTSCSLSSATTVYFPLQADLANGGTSTYYYIYYDSPNASTYPAADALDAYDIGAKSATFVAPFNGTTTALAAGSGTPTTETGAVRYSGSKSAASFDGVNDNVTVTNVAVNPAGNSITVEAWVMLTKSTSGVWAPIVQEGSGSIFLAIDGTTCDGVGSGARIHFSVNGYDCDSRGLRGSTQFVLNRWYHVVGIYNGSQLKTYVDGVLDGSKDFTYTLGNSFSFTVGKVYDPNFPVVKSIDEVRVSNIVRYTSNFTPQTAPFVRDEYTKLLLHFDENGDDPRNTGKAIDDSGNGNHGTISGAKYVGGLVGVDGSSNLTNLSNLSNSGYAAHSGIFIEEGTTNKITNPSFENSTSYATNWSNPAVFDYDSSVDTFTAGAAKRNSAGPFAAGILTQGNTSTSSQKDVISFSGGNQISGSFYNQFDSNQGTIVLWYTPEISGSNPGSELFSFDNGNNMGIYAFSTNLYFAAMGNDMHKAANFVAGTTYLIIARWDTKNTFDGTNKLSLTINNSTTFGGTGAGSILSPTNPFYVGSGQSHQYAANGIIEGLTVYRRPLYAETSPASGIDVGNGDEINQIWGGAIASSKDPTLVTGSWDVVFALPTNSSTGSLLTGTGNAWSHPHASNLLYTSTTNTGGFMMNGTYATDGFADVGTPTSVGALATAEKIFAGGYKHTSDAVNEGIYRAFTATSGGDYVLRAVGHSDGTCNPQIKITRADGTTEITHLNGTTTSTRTAPNVYIFAWESPAAESEQVQLINTASSGTCYWHQVEVLSNLIDNPSMERVTGTPDPWIPDNWSNYYLSAGGSQQTTVNQHSGSNAIQYNNSATGLTGINYAKAGVMTVNKFYNSGFMAKSDGTKQLNLCIHVGLVSWQSLLTSQNWCEGTTSTTWKLVPAVIRHINPSSSWVQHNLYVNNGGVGYADDAYYFQLSDVSLTVTPASEANSLETSGLRVDGTDTLTQPIDSLTATSGTIKFKFTPRHSFSTAALFGNTNPSIMMIYKDGNNRIELHRNVDGNLQAVGVFNGTVVYAIGALTLNAGTTYEIELSYLAGGSLAVKVDGVQKATNTGVVAFSDTPNIIYWGSNNSGASQFDATFAAPAFTGTVTPTENTTASYYKFGTKSTKLVAAADGQYVTSINPGNTNSHTLSAYVYDGTSGNVGGTVSATVAKLVFNGSVVTPASYTDMGGGWWRMTYTTTTTNTTDTYGVAILSGKTIYVDGVQLEQKAYATTYADGTMGTGYAWTGTANESTSTRTATSTQYARSSNITSSTGSVSMWVKPNWGYGDGLAHGLFSIDSNNGSEPIWLMKTGTGWWSGANKLLFIHQNYCNGPNVTINWTANKWHHILVTWSGSSSTIYVDNSATTVANCAIGTTFGDGNNFTVGHLTQNYTASNSNSDSVISGVAVFSSSLSSTEVADLYYAGLGSHSSLAETATERFTGEEQPVLAWKFDEGNGTTANDSSIYKNSGTISGASWSPQGLTLQAQQGETLQFDGVDDKVSRAYNNDTELAPGTDPFSASVWFRHSSTLPVAQQTLLSRYGTAGYKIYMDTSGYLCFGVDDDSSWGPDDSACTTTSYADSKWHFINVIKDITVITLYMDGVQKAQTTLTATGSLNGNATTLYVGIDSNGTSNPWAGWIDEVRIYDSASSADEVKTHYNAGEALRGVSASLADQGTLADGLVGYWKMDEGSWNGTAGEVIDSSGNGNNGTSVNSTTTASGKFGNGGSFNGTSNSITITDSTSLKPSNQVTVTAWINTNSTSGTQGIFDHESGTPWYGYYFYLYGGKVYFELYTTSNQTATGTTTLPTSQWIFVSATYDGSNVRVYVNGTQDGILAKTGSINYTQTVNPAIGSRYSGTSHLFNGKIDETRIYNRALSPAEVRDLYNYAPGPVRYWKLDDGSSTTVVDSSGNSNGTWNGTGSHWGTGKFGGGGSFNGTSDFVGGGTFASTRYTAEAWVKVNSGSAAKQGIMQAGSSNGFADKFIDVIIEGGNLHAIINKMDAACTGVNTSVYDINSGVNIRDGLWHHVAQSYDGTTMTLYLDGVVKGTPITTSGPTCNTGTFQFGVTGYLAYDNGPYYLNGSMDDVRIYNYARTQKQIVQDMNADHPAVGSPVGSAVAYYKFDEGQGIVANNAGNGGSTLNGTLTNMASPATATSGWTNSGKFGKGVVFDGGNDFMEVADNDILDFGISTDFSWSFWLKGNTPATAKRILFKGQNNGESSMYWAASINTNGMVYGAILDTGGVHVQTVTSTSSVTDNNWHHVEITGDRDSSTGFKIYIDGVNQATSNPTSVADLSNNGKLYFAYRPATGDYYNGALDEVKIYNYALTEDEVKTEYNRGAAMVLGSLGTESDGTTGTNSTNRSYCPPGNTEGNCAAGLNPAPVAEWNFDAGSGQTAVDTSGNNNTGTLGASSAVGSDDPSWTNGKVGKGLNFDGVNDYVDTTSTFGVGGIIKFTLSAWVKKTSLQYSFILQDTGIYGVGFELYPSIAYFNLMTNGSTNSYGYTSISDDGSWKYYVMVYDGSQSFNSTRLRAWINGIEQTLSFSGTIPSSFSAEAGATWKIGRRPWSVAYSSGSIDQVRIYNYARSPAQIAWDYNRGAPVAWYKMDECLGSTIHSDSGQARMTSLDATIYPGSNDNTSVGTCGSGVGIEMWNDGTSGKFGASLGFDGQDDYVGLSGSLSTNSVAFWVKPTSDTASMINLTATQYISASGGAITATNFTSPTYYVNGIATTTPTLTANQWNHVVVTTATAITANAITFGKANGAYTAGQMDDVRLYNYALTPVQVKDVYTGGAVWFGD